MDDEDLRKTLHDYLRGKKYFGVMDDIWDTDAWKEMKDVFPNDLNGSRILITSRRKEVALDASLTIKPHSLQPLNGDDSWKLLCKKVFQEEESILSGTSRKGTCGRLTAEHLHKQLDNLEYVSEIIQTLDGMSTKSSSTARQAAIGALMNTRMTRRSVRDHCLKMMAHISTAEVMGAKLEQEMKIDMILEFLPDRFS
nr:putative disease resistance RPP13-like protein 3 [Ziziphus jujuba var. spinosa]